MKRTTISLSDSVREMLEDYVNNQEVSPSISAVVNQALVDFLKNESLVAELRKRGLELDDLKPFPKEIYSFSKTLTKEADVSINHDKYLAEIVADGH